MARHSFRTIVLAGTGYLELQFSCIAAPQVLCGAASIAIVELRAESETNEDKIAELSREKANKAGCFIMLSNMLPFLIEPCTVVKGRITPFEVWL